MNTFKVGDKVQYTWHDGVKTEHTIESIKLGNYLLYKLSNRQSLVTSENLIKL